MPGWGSRFIRRLPLLLPYTAALAFVEEKTTLLQLVFQVAPWMRYSFELVSLFGFWLYGVNDFFSQGEQHHGRDCSQMENQHTETHHSWFRIQRQAVHTLSTNSSLCFRRRHDGGTSFCGFLSYIMLNLHTCRGESAPCSGSFRAPDSRLQA